MAWQAVQGCENGVSDTILPCLPRPALHHAAMCLQDIPGGHPYMLSLGILGGIAAFENPLQGCLLVSELLLGYDRGGKLQKAGSSSPSGSLTGCRAPSCCR